MRYTKTQVRGIVDEVVRAMEGAELGIENNTHFQRELELIKEAHLLIDRRLSPLAEYRTDVLRDFMETRLSYKDIMRKYHASLQTIKTLLAECAENDERVNEEIEARKQ